MLESLSGVLAFLVFAVLSVADVCSQVRIDTARSDTLLENPQMQHFLLSNRAVRDDLELAGEQLKQIEAGVAEIQVELEAYRDEIRKASREGASSEVRESLRNEQTSKLALQLRLIREELLPHQIERIRQIAFQFEVSRQKNTDPSALMLAPKLVTDLNISDQQKANIASAYKKRDEVFLQEYSKFEQKFRELQKKAYDDILAELTTEQRAEVEQHVGSPSSALLSAQSLSDSIKANSELAK